MAAYYNELEPFAAAWLRELIARNIIAPGDVDERSIKDVSPSDLAGYTQCHFFAGIGVWSYALRCAGWPDDRPVWTGSCPCPPFSSAGIKKACPQCAGCNPVPHVGRTGYFVCCLCGHEWLADERHLWPELWRLVAVGRPVALLGEQVASGDGRIWLATVRASLELLGYAVGSADTSAASVGAPHIRQRLYFVAESDRGRTGELARVVHGDEGEHEVRRANGNHASITGRAAGDVADSNGDGQHQAGRCESSAGNDGGPLGNGGPRVLGDSKRNGCRAQPVRSAPAEATREGQRRVRAHESGELGLTEREGLEGHAGDVDDRHESGRVGAVARGPVAETGATGDVGDASSGGRGELWHAPFGGAGRHPEGAGVGGFWSGAEWIPCRNPSDPARVDWRPVEPGTFPLAHGAAARVGRLRGYGNALVAPQAEAFIEAYLDVRGAA